MGYALYTAIRPEHKLQNETSSSQLTHYNKVLCQVKVSWQNTQFCCTVDIMIRMCTSCATSDHIIPLCASSSGRLKGFRRGIIIRVGIKTEWKGVCCRDYKWYISIDCYSVLTSYTSSGHYFFFAHVCINNTLFRHVVGAGRIPDHIQSMTLRK